MILRELSGKEGSQRQKARGSNHMSAVYQTQEAIQEQFRRTENREQRFNAKVAKERKATGNYHFKERYEEYFADNREDRYKTKNLLAREQARAHNAGGQTSLDSRLKLITQKVKSSLQRSRPKSASTGMPTKNYVTAPGNPYGEPQVRMTSQDLIETVTSMIHEDSANSIGHQSKLQRIKKFATRINSDSNHDTKNQNPSCQTGQKDSTSNDNEKEVRNRALIQLEQIAASQSVQENRSNKGEFKFSLVDKLQHSLGQQMMDQTELYLAEQTEARNQQINMLLDNNNKIKQTFTDKQFRELVDMKDPNSFLQDVALRLYQRFEGARLRGDAHTVPNLQSQAPFGSKKKGSEPGTHLFQLLLLSVSQADRDQFMKLRDGHITLSQLINEIEANKTGGRRLLCLDDIRHELIPEAFERPDRHVSLAQREVVKEKNLIKQARKRGVDEKILSETAKNISVLAKCARSVYNQPKRRKRSEVNSKNAFALKEVMRKEKEDTRVEKEENLARARALQLAEKLLRHTMGQEIDKQKEAKRAASSAGRRGPCSAKHPSVYDLEAQRMLNPHSTYKLTDALKPKIIDNVITAIRGEKDRLLGERAYQRPWRGSNPHKPLNQCEGSKVAMAGATSGSNNFEDPNKQRLDADQDLRFLIRLFEDEQELREKTGVCDKEELEDTGDAAEQTLIVLPNHFVFNPEELKQSQVLTGQHIKELDPFFRLKAKTADKIPCVLPESPKADATIHSVRQAAVASSPTYAQPQFGLAPMRRPCGTIVPPARVPQTMPEPVGSPMEQTKAYTIEQAQKQCAGICQVPYESLKSIESRQAIILQEQNTYLRPSTAAKDLVAYGANQPAISPKYQEAASNLQSVEKRRQVAQFSNVEDFSAKRERFRQTGSSKLSSQKSLSGNSDQVRTQEYQLNMDIAHMASEVAAARVAPRHASQAQLEPPDKDKNSLNQSGNDRAVSTVRQGKESFVSVNEGTGTRLWSGKDSVLMRFESTQQLGVPDINGLTGHLSASVQHHHQVQSAHMTISQAARLRRSQDISNSIAPQVPGTVGTSASLRYNKGLPPGKTRKGRLQSATIHSKLRRSEPPISSNLRTDRQTETASASAAAAGTVSIKVPESLHAWFDTNMMRTSVSPPAQNNPLFFSRTLGPKVRAQGQRPLTASQQPRARLGQGEVAYSFQADNVARCVQYRSDATVPTRVSAATLTNKALPKQTILVAPTEQDSFIEEDGPFGSNELGSGIGIQQTPNNARQLAEEYSSLSGVGFNWLTGTVMNTDQVSNLIHKVQLKQIQIDRPILSTTSANDAAQHHQHHQHQHHQHQQPQQHHQHHPHCKIVSSQQDSIHTKGQTDGVLNTHLSNALGENANCGSAMLDRYSLPLPDEPMQHFHLLQMRNFGAGNSVSNLKANYIVPSTIRGQSDQTSQHMMAHQMTQPLAEDPNESELVIEARSIRAKPQIS